MDYSALTKYLTEAIGTAIIVLFGNGAATMARKGSKHGTLFAGVGFALGLTLSTMLFGLVSAQFNPAVTIGLAVSGFFKWNQTWEYILWQIGGAIVGQLIVVALRYRAYQEMDDPTQILSSFSTIPAADDRTYAQRSVAMVQGAVNEFIASFIFVFGIMAIIGYYVQLTVSQAAQAAASGQGSAVKASDPTVFAQSATMAFGPYYLGGAIAIGLLGGALIWFTGSSINPARDFGPRLVHQFLPKSAISEAKDDSRWWYAWVPIVMPILAGIAAVALYKLIYLK